MSIRVSNTSEGFVSIRARCSHPRFVSNRVGLHCSISNSFRVESCRIRAKPCRVSPFVKSPISCRAESCQDGWGFRVSRRAEHSCLFAARAQRRPCRQRIPTSLVDYVAILSLEYVNVGRSRSVRAPRVIIGMRLRQASCLSACELGIFVLGSSIHALAIRLDVLKI